MLRLLLMFRFTWLVVLNSFLSSVGHSNSGAHSCLRGVLGASRGRGGSLPNVAFIEARVKWCQSWSASFHLRPLRSTCELASIPPAVPPTASSLANPPTGPPDIRNSVYSAIRLVERQAHQERLAALRGEGEPTSPLSSRRLPVFSDINESF